MKRQVERFLWESEKWRKEGFLEEYRRAGAERLGSELETGKLVRSLKFK